MRTLVLIATQYKMPGMLLKLQNLIFRFMPDSKFVESDFQKNVYIKLCGSMAKLDFSKSIRNIYCPVLVVYGEKDIANKKASVEMAKRLKRGMLKEIKGSGHEVNIDAPEALGELLDAFYKRLGSC